MPLAVLGEKVRQPTDSHAQVALVRLEQLYPAPIDELNAVIDSYPNAELVWVQDEPENQGAWPFIALEVVKHLHGRTIRRVSRAAAASTATALSARPTTLNAGRPAISWTCTSTRRASSPR